MALLLVVILAACGDGPGDGDGASGVRGRALAGPQCPVEMADSPCPDLPWEGTVVATASDSGEAFTASTDADGRFELPGLPPGDYEVEAWHERLGTRTLKAKLDAKAVLDVEFVFTGK